MTDTLVTTGCVIICLLAVTVIVLLVRDMLRERERWRKQGEQEDDYD